MEAKIEVETLNKVLDYLSTRPYREVYNLIKLTQQAVVITEPESDTINHEQSNTDGTV